MVSINTNLSSLVAQNNLTKSTNALNTAIERLTTGYKINHASDNAANYSIANDYSAKLSSYQVAQENTASGLDLLTVAQDTISLMQEHGARIHQLITQAQNGTYGGQSLDAINQEISARIGEIERLYNNAEYNGVKVLDSMLPDWAIEVKSQSAINAGTTSDISATNDGFMAAIEKITPDVVIEEASELEAALSDSTKTKVGIANADVLAELAKIVNGTDGYAAKDCTGKTIVLTDDIDLSAYQSGEGWTLIGTKTTSFKGVFDGQGHKITGLKINRDAEAQGLFGVSIGDIKNTAVIDVFVSGGKFTGILVGLSRKYASNVYKSIENCYVSGEVSGTGTGIGGLAGNATINIENSYAKAKVTSAGSAGGLIGTGQLGYAKNCFAEGDVTSTSNNVGGVIGQSSMEIENCYATGNVSGNNYVGGLIGETYAPNAMKNITDSYATGNVTGNNEVGGLYGGYIGNGSFIDCYATGNVKSISGYDIGGLVENFSSKAIKIHILQVM